MKINYCINCGKKLKPKTAKRCWKCWINFNIGKNHLCYIDGRSIGNLVCIDCGIKISYGHKRCKKCAKQGKLHSGYKGGKPKCKICGKQVWWTSNRCRTCWGKAVSGKNSVLFGKCHNIYQLFFYKNFKFRSSYEANFAKWCDGSNIKWKYESKTFNLGKTTYTPDFYLPTFDCYIEIKGFWRPDAYKKFKECQRKYKNINLKVFQKEDLQELGIIK